MNLVAVPDMATAMFFTAPAFIFSAFSKSVSALSTALYAAQLIIHSGLLAAIKLV